MLLQCFRFNSLMKFFFFEVHLAYGKLLTNRKIVPKSAPTFELCLSIFQPVLLQSSLSLVKSILFSKFTLIWQFEPCSNEFSPTVASKGN